MNDIVYLFIGLLVGLYGFVKVEYWIRKEEAWNKKNISPNPNAFSALVGFIAMIALIFLWPVLFVLVVFFYVLWGVGAVVAKLYGWLLSRETTKVDYLRSRKP